MQLGRNADGEKCRYYQSRQEQFNIGREGRNAAGEDATQPKQTGATIFRRGRNATKLW